ENELAVRYFPVSGIPDGSFAVVDSLVGRVARSRLYPGEAVLDAKLAPLGAQPGIEVKIALGYRAMAIRISDVVGRTGLVRPGSRVDVLVTISAEKARRSQPISKIILQNMRVLSVGTETERGDPSKPMISSAVTLEVLPEEAELLAIAMNEGTLSLALRSYGDRGNSTTPGATTEKVLAGVAVSKPQPARRPARRSPPRRQPTAPVVVTPPPDSTRVIEIYRGIRRSEEVVVKDSVERNR
ncbi:MAG: Flp pilus assembly protein CpaB, partial [Gemmatimonadota bacterium]